MRWEAKYPFLAKIVDGLRFLGDLLAVNLLWLFTSLPIVTVGAASSAAYAVLLRYVREGDVPILKTYFQSLRENFLQATALWLISIAMAFVVYVDWRFAGTMEGSLHTLYLALSVVLCAAIAVFAGMRHGSGLAVQVFSTSLLAAVPAGYFVALTRPAAILEKRLHMVGTVLCGWKGIKNLRGNAVFPLKDEDLFPQGSSKLNGVKFYGDRSPDEVVSYAASLICRAGGGLEHVFRQLLASRGGRELPVSNFRNYGGGGIGGEVCGEAVLLGSCSFLRDMGVEVPGGSAVNQAVYAAIDGDLCAVVAISYAKMRSSSAGLVSLCSSRKLTPILVGSDFMITADMLREKFGINTRRMGFPSQEERTELASRQIDGDAFASALTTREDLTSFAYAISGARALRVSAVLGTVIHVLGGLLGMVIMLALAYLGSAELLTPTNVLLYQLVWLLPGLLVTEWTRAV